MKASNKIYWVGLDLGGTKMLAKVYDGAFKELGAAKRKTEGHRGLKSVISRMEATIRDAMSEAGIKESQLSGIGIGCPGPVDPEDGMLLAAPNLGWIDVPVRKIFTKAFGCPVVACNDVDSGVFGEYKFGAAKGARSAVGIFPGTGIGGGAVIHGRLLEGANITCMEIGHTPFGETGQTLEQVCSRLAIASESAAAAYRGQAPHILESCGTDMAKITSGKIADAIENGDKAIEKIVKQAADRLGSGVATVVQLMAPEVIVLGGGLVEAMPKLFLKTLKKSVDDKVLGPFRGKYKIVAAKLGDDAGVQGAAAWAAKSIDG
ncbi:MAG: ROK family protein [Verrucomicrobiales bacterium]|nr:ROK family protein [Verrucomicrobiales bacterium]